MIYKSPCLLIDVVDPLSFFAHLQVGSVEQATGTVVQRIPVELRPPPAELIDADHPFWLQRWKQAEALAEEFSLSLKKPRLMPWSRKAHELLYHARASGLDEASQLIDLIFEAFLHKGKDIGRVDVLVAIGQSVGLELSETKAVLDIDRYEAEVSDALEYARSLKAEVPPVLIRDHKRLRDFHNDEAIGTFLAVN